MKPVRANVANMFSFERPFRRNYEMSEKKVSEILMETLQGIQKQLDEMKKSQSSTTLTHEEPKGHKDLDDLLNCPTCKGKLIEKLKPDVEKNLKVNWLKDMNEKLKSKELLTCNGCGEIVEKTREDCPTCHGKHAH